MNTKQRNEVREAIVNELAYLMDSEYRNEIADNILTDVIVDIEETADEKFNDSDIRLAIARVLVARTERKLT